MEADVTAMTNLGAGAETFTAAASGALGLH
jgi:hypothetical protein